MKPAHPTCFSAADEPDEFLAAQRLATALLPSHRLRTLLENADGLPSVALGLPAKTLQSPEIALTDKQVTRLQDAARPPIPPKLLPRAIALGASVITLEDPSYPQHLLPLQDAPPLLFMRGRLHPEDQNAIAMVGSRRATLYGRGQADRFARTFAEAGILVVSGGAAGIDTAAHKGALEGGGRTVAILGCGVDVTYPAENRALFNQIVERGGAVLSEFPMETTPEPWRFPTRNRIIAGMTRLTLVLESPADSGALITARNAADYGRDVWAVPGTVDSGRSKGCHRLIQDGAGLADEPEDVLSAIGLITEARLPPSPPARKPRTRSAPEAPALPPSSPEPTPAPLPLPTSIAGLSSDEEKLLARFDGTPRHVEDATMEAGLSAAQAAVAITLLEMKSLLRRQPGNLFVRTSS